MKHHISKLATIAVLALATSCASTKYMAIDVLQPAQINYADNIVNLGIVDNAGASISSDDTSVEADPKNILISESKDVFLHSLTQFMNEENYFNDVKLYPIATRTDKNYGVQVPLAKSTINQIAKEIDVDAVLVLDTYDTSSKEQILRADGYIFSASFAETSVMLRLYNASGSPLTPYMATTDSITWVGDHTGVDDVTYIQRLALQLAESTTKTLLPHWESQERIYYTDGTSLMKTAHKFVEKKEWAEAAKTWGAAFEAQKNNKQKAKIAANIALANENLGDITNAAEWVRIASNMLEGDKNSDEAIYINWYKIKILEREQNNPKVLNQMGLEEVTEEN